MKILIADDDPVTLHRLMALAKQFGFDPIAASDGLQAWEALLKDPAVHIAILDWQMPGLTGDEICRQARLRLSNRSLHLILLTAARTELQDKVDAVGAGADDHLTKPFMVPELIARLRVGERVVRLQNELRQRLADLEAAVAQIKHLQGLLPICAYCKKIRDDQNYWHQVEEYIGGHADVQFTHGICPECFEKQKAQILKPESVAVGEK